MRILKCALIGVSGFGETHLTAIEKMEEKGRLKLQAVCDSNYKENRDTIDRLVSKEVNFYKDYKEMLRKESCFDFVTVSTPIHLHRIMAVDIMRSGFHVFLEKPPAILIQDFNKIISASKKTKKLCAVNFMLTSGKAFLKLGKLIESGVLGRITCITGIGLWKRLDNYYSRAPWAGKMMFNGIYVLDGTINNSLSHLLNNMLFLAMIAGNEHIVKVTAELYHGHCIEGEDTSCLKAELNCGTELYYYATLCSSKQEVPSIIVEGTKGKAFWNYENVLRTEICGETTEEVYENDDEIINMYENLMNVLTGEDEQFYCPVEATRNFVLLSNGAFESSGKIHNIDSRFVLRTAEQGSTTTYIEGIEEIIHRAASLKSLFSEIGTEWAISGKEFKLRNYRKFNIL